jgi:hypothetical protein
MNISEMIMKLYAVKAEHGDLPVVGDRGEPEITVLEEKDEFEICVHIG